VDVQEGTFDLIDTMDQNPHMSSEEAADFYNQKGGHQLREVIKNQDGSLTLVDKFRRRKGVVRDAEKFQTRMEQEDTLYDHREDRRKDEARAKFKIKMDTAKIKNPNLRPYVKGQELGKYEMVQVMGPDNEQWVIRDDAKIKFEQDLAKKKDAKAKEKLEAGSVLRLRNLSTKVKLPS